MAFYQKPDPPPGGGKDRQTVRKSLPNMILRHVFQENTAHVVPFPLIERELANLQGGGDSN